MVQQEKKLEEEEKKRQQQEKKLEEQEKKQDEQKKKVVQQEKKLEEEEKKLQQQERKLGEQERKQEKKLGDQNKITRTGEEVNRSREWAKERGAEIEAEDRRTKYSTTAEAGRTQTVARTFNSKLQMLEQMLKEVVDKSVQNEGKLSMMSSMIYLNRRFEMKNFSREKAKDKFSDWKSPAMYTHVCGYKFCIGVDANGCRGVGHGNSIWMDLWSMPGEYDDQLKWPANAKFTIELINQTGRRECKAQ